MVVMMIMMTAVVGQQADCYLGLGGWLLACAGFTGVVSPGDSELRQSSLPHSLDSINLCKQSHTAAWFNEHAVFSSSRNVNTISACYSPLQPKKRRSADSASLMHVRFKVFVVRATNRI